MQLGDCPKANVQAFDWISSELNKVIIDLESNYKSYRISEGLMSLYSFVWTDFCSWYLEMIKPEYGKPIDRKSYENSIAIFEKICFSSRSLMGCCLFSFFSNCLSKLT